MNILEILGRIGFDWQVALLNFINFLIVFWLLKRFVFKPITNVLGSRKKIIDEGLENAKRAETNLMMAKEQANKTVDEAKAESNRIIAQAKEEGDIILDGVKIKSQEESAEIISQANVAIEKERTRMEADLRVKTADLVIEGLEKVLKQEIDKDKNKELINQLTE